MEWRLIRCGARENPLIPRLFQRRLTTKQQREISRDSSYWPSGEEVKMASRWRRAAIWTLVSVNSVGLVLGGLITWLSYAIPMRLRHFGLAPQLAQLAGLASLLVACLGLCALNYSSHYALNVYGLSCVTFALLMLFGSVPLDWSQEQHASNAANQQRQTAQSDSSGTSKTTSTSQGEQSVDSSARASPNLLLDLVYFTLLGLLLVLLLAAFALAHYLRRKQADYSLALGSTSSPAASEQLDEVTVGELFEDKRDWSMLQAPALVRSSAVCTCTAAGELEASAREDGCRLLCASVERAKEIGARRRTNQPLHSMLTRLSSQMYCQPNCDHYSQVVTENLKAPSAPRISTIFTTDPRYQQPLNQQHRQYFEYQNQQQPQQSDCFWPSIKLRPVSDCGCVRSADRHDQQQHILSEKPLVHKAFYRHPSRSEENLIGLRSASVNADQRTIDIQTAYEAGGLKLGGQPEKTSSISTAKQQARCSCHLSRAASSNRVSSAWLEVSQLQAQNSAYDLLAKLPPRYYCTMPKINLSSVYTTSASSPKRSHLSTQLEQRRKVTGGRSVMAVKAAAATTAIIGSSSDSASMENQISDEINSLEQAPLELHADADPADPLGLDQVRPHSEAIRSSCDTSPAKEQAAVIYSSHTTLQQTPISASPT